MAQGYKLRLGDGTTFAVDEKGLLTWLEGRLMDESARIQPQGTKEWLTVRQLKAFERDAAERAVVERRYAEKQAGFARKAAEAQAEQERKGRGRGSCPRGLGEQGGVRPSRGPSGDQRKRRRAPRRAAAASAQARGAAAAQRKAAARRRAEEARPRKGRGGAQAAQGPAAAAS